MKSSTFIIDYGVYLIGGHYESHTIKVKNCMSELHAKIKLEEYLKKKHAKLERLVDHKCINDWLGVSEIFGKGNPFGC
jgi:hypothetical protein